MLSDLNKFNSFMEDRENFSFSTFGTPEQRGCVPPLLHLQDEIKELIEDSDSNLEWADCLLLLLDAAARKGHSMDDLLNFCIQKLEINKKRTWAKQENGVFKHTNRE